LTLTEALAHETARSEKTQNEPWSSHNGRGLLSCRPWLLRQIEILRPRVIVTLGRHALAEFLPDAAIGDCHGRPQPGDRCTIVPLYHPSYALHNRAVRPLLFRDMEILRTLLRSR
jgi:uracil-DNA glycosylase family 4